MPDPAVTVSVAKEVAAMLAAATLSQSFTVERSYAEFDIPLNDYDRTRVDVAAVMTAQEVELVARGTPAGAKLAYTVPVDIAVRRKLGHDKQSDATGKVEIEHVDDLVLLVQEIHELFAKSRLTNFQAGVHLETRIIASPIKKYLRENRQFTGIVRVTFRVDRTLT